MFIKNQQIKETITVYHNDAQSMIYNVNALVQEGWSKDLSAIEVERMTEEELQVFLKKYPAIQPQETMFAAKPYFFVFRTIHERVITDVKEIQTFLNGNRSLKKNCSFIQKGMVIRTIPDNQRMKVQSVVGIGKNTDFTAIDVEKTDASRFEYWFSMKEQGITWKLDVEATGDMYIDYTNNEALMQLLVHMGESVQSIKDENLWNTTNCEQKKQRLNEWIQFLKEALM